MEVVITICKQPDNKYDAVIDGKKKISFGASGYSDFTKHNNTDIQKRYIARHKHNEDWTKSGAKDCRFLQSVDHLEQTYFKSKYR